MGVRRRPVVEDMAEMAAALAAMDFGADHEMAGVPGWSRPRPAGDRKARPARAALELFCPERNSSWPQPTQKNAPRRFSWFRAQEPGRSVPWRRKNVILLRREQGAPFLIAAGDLELFDVMEASGTRTAYK